MGSRTLKKTINKTIKKTIGDSSNRFDFITYSKEQTQVLDATDAHVLYCGQGGCGKTYTGAGKALIIGSYYPNSCIALIRKKRVDLKATLWKVFDEKILGKDNKDGFIVESNDSELYRKISNGSV